MGYTHYWRQRRDFTDSEWASITAIANAIVKHEAEYLDHDPASDECANVNDTHIRLNGIGDDSHETFLLTRAKEAKPEYADQADYDATGAFSFCKTAQKPYDSAVLAILLAAEHYAPAAIVVSSDGDWPEDYKPALRVLVSIGHPEISASKRIHGERAA